MAKDETLQKGIDWFAHQGWQPFPFQVDTWRHYLDGKHGLVNAPTGSGKTYALFVPILLEYFRKHALHPPSKNLGLQAIWITPIRALAKEINIAAQRAIDGLGIAWEVGIRTGDTSAKDRARQKRRMPAVLITTPESLHLLMASKGYAQVFKNVKAVVVDEWHELIGSKRGVLMELALSRLKTTSLEMKIWGISATIGNMQQAIEVLLGYPLYHQKDKYEVVKANIKKAIEIESILPDEIEKMPWAGHLGIKLLEKVVPIIKNSNATLVFTNTRAFAEIWYQKLLDHSPELAGSIAMHHGSISRELRDWVENALYNEQLKAVVCTSSLDLGVDFRPVETIIQVGSPKGVARFIQRAGRSGHQPGATSKIYFVPTHSLELIEAAALRHAVSKGNIEKRTPYIRSFDVLAQYLVTLAVSDGFTPNSALAEVKTTFSYQSISQNEWQWVLNFITTGGVALTAYDEYHKVIVEDNCFKVDKRGIAMRHRLSIGTIVSDSALQVKYLSGKRIGNIEEWFIAQLNPGDVFWFAGRSLELVRVKGMEAQVRKTNKKNREGAFMARRQDAPVFANVQNAAVKAAPSHFARQKRNRVGNSCPFACPTTTTVSSAKPKRISHRVLFDARRVSRRYVPLRREGSARRPRLADRIPYRTNHTALVFNRHERLRLRTPLRPGNTNIRSHRNQPTRCGKP